jgi:hypothetical protein
MKQRHVLGDVARVIRESLRDVRGRVALATVTAPGGTFATAEASAWNSGAGKQWRLLRDRIKREMWRKYELRPPVVLVRVAQRQSRGLDHLHLVWWCVNAEHEERIRRWVELYRVHNEAYGFGFVDDPFRVRRSKKTGKRHDMIFAKAEVAGIYLGNYLKGGQLERLVASTDASWRACWISPVLQQRSGWSVERCRWVRQAWHIARGTWDKRTWYGTARYPRWWDDDELREWMCRATGWDGVPGSAIWRIPRTAAATSA